jgi:hypothetical protein
MHENRRPYPIDSFSKSEKCIYKGDIRDSTYLNEKDLEVMTRGLDVLKNYFNELTSHELPDTLVFPETSARPLVYLIKPLLEQVYKSKGVPLPSLQFFNIPSGKDFQDYMRLGEATFLENKRSEIEDEIDYLVEEQYESNSPEEEQEYGRQIECYEGEISGIEEKYTHFKNSKVLSEELMEEIISKSKGNLFFVDDYVYKGSTFELLNEIQRKVESKNNKTVSTQYFSFFDQNPDNGLSDKVDRPYFYGSSSKDDGLEQYIGFKYRSTPSTFCPEKGALYKQENERHIGVKRENGEKYVSKSDLAKYADMAEFRRELSQMGNEFVGA